MCPPKIVPTVRRGRPYVRGAAAYRPCTATYFEPMMNVFPFGYYSVGCPAYHAPTRHSKRRFRPGRQLVTQTSAATVITLIARVVEGLTRTNDDGTPPVWFGPVRAAAET